MPNYESEIKRRRTFAIISHPDAGKTTLTEKFLLYGGAIAQAGQVKGKKNTRAATSDWMEIEKQRGISVTSSVMQFQYEGYCINILDTPGHQDFSEDTYRTLMAAEREIIEEAYAGDIIGVFDPGIFSIGDTLCAPSRKFCFDPIPTFAPEHFERIRSVDTMKRKQFLKGVEQIAQEGAIQIFKTPYSGMEEVIVGVVGTLQFDVLEYRLRSEYNVELYKEGLPYEYLRWIVREEDAPPLKEEDLLLPNDAKLVEDYKGNQLLLFASQWSIQWVSDRNKGLKLAEFGGAKF